MIGKTISRFKIFEKLGAGGMGEVYLAEDTELDRKIALKFLPAEYTTDLEIKARFKREAKAAAALNHPNIITIHEVGEHEGKAYIAMEYVEGGSLKELISKKEFSINKAIEISMQLCEVLHEAHKAGIVHRDLKPANILIDKSGRVKIIDFGLAKLKDVTKLTKESSTLGTLSYMSPEQIQSADVDHRSDIFSFGVILYEMITGQLPFKGEYDAAVSYSILYEEPEPLVRYKAGVPEELQRVVNKALEKDPQTRYQHIDDVLTDLKREQKSALDLTKKVKQQRKPLALALSGTVFLVLILMAARHFFSAGETESKERIPIAVADFVNETKEPELNALSGMLITALEQSQRLSVLTRSRMFEILRQLGKPNVDGIDETLGREICKKAQTNLMVMASINRLGRVYTIDMKILNVQKNQYVFTAREEGEGQESVLKMIDALSEKTRRNLKEWRAEIFLGHQNIAEVTTTNFEAYQHYFRGEQFIAQLRIKEAQTEFTKALAKDSLFALAHYRLAYAIEYLHQNEHLAKVHIQKALDLVDRIPQKERFLVRALDMKIEIMYKAAIAILKDMEKIYPNDIEMLYSIGDNAVHAGIDSLAIPYLEKVLSLDSTHVRALTHLGYAYQNPKTYDIAASYFEKALRVSSKDINPIVYADMAVNLKLRGKFAEAVEFIRKALDLDPNWGILWCELGGIFYDQEDFVQAERAYRTALDIDPESVRVKTELLILYLLMKDYAAAERQLRELLSTDTTNPRINRYMGFLFAEQERFAEAEVFAQMSVAVDSSFNNINLLAWVLIAGEKDVERGFALAQNVFEIKPENYMEMSRKFPFVPVPEHTLGLAYMKKGQYKEAQQFLKQAAERFPKRQKIHDDLLLAQRKMRETINK